ncbi:MAG TPA: alpha-L-fucosidase, partial [Tichowtungia sp.]|nr:alpha-L-fucosidase [Tichowtungia sp.]
EILTRYQPDVLWWDTPETITQEQTDKFVPLLRLAPGIITNNRLGGGYKGDTETPEQFVPPTGFKDRDFEVCMTMNGTWGYKSWDHNWKSTEDIIRKLCDIASKGGNFLLNIGPKADGTIPQPSVDRLKEIGDWMDINSEAIYGTTASPFGRFLWGRSTVKMRNDGATVYLHVFDWPKDGKLVVPGFVSTPESVGLLDGKKPLSFTAFDKNGVKGITIDLPAAAPDPIASVIKLEVSGEPDFEKVLPTQSADGTLTLPPNEAYMHSNSKRHLRVQMIDGKDSIGNWLADKSWIYWKFRVSEPGTFTLCSEAAAQSNAVLTVQLKDGERKEAAAVSEGDGHKIYEAEEYATLEGHDKQEVAIEATGGENIFKPADLGTMEVKKSGVYVLEVRPVKDRWSPIKLRSIRLNPAQKNR